MNSAAKKHEKRIKKPRRRVIDEEKGRQAQFWWMIGVAVALLVSAYFRGNQAIEAQAERVPAQALPYFQAQSR